MAITGGRRATVGAWGEAQAAVFLERMGWQILERNWRCEVGEIDLVAREPDGTVVGPLLRSRGPCCR